jgi:hypothetical protein
VVSSTPARRLQRLISWARRHKVLASVSAGAATLVIVIGAIAGSADQGKYTAGNPASIRTTDPAGPLGLFAPETTVAATNPTTINSAPPTPSATSAKPKAVVQPPTDRATSPATTPPALHTTSPTGKTTSATTTANPPAHADPTAALTVLATLAVKGRAPKTGYDRDQFGSAWHDTDRNGCDQRNDVLRRDLTDLTIKAGTNGCLVLTGVLHDPYTGKTIDFTRGVGTSTAVQIDHVVALSDAWQTGAQQLSAATREDFANDPLELLAVDGPTNESKGDGDAATWLPPNKSERCAYVARQIAVKAKYGLWVTSAEKQAMIRVLAPCPNQKVPTSSAIPLDTEDVVSAPTNAPKTTTPPAKKTTPAVKKTTPPVTHTTTPAGGSVYYKNCSAVRAAGKAPLHRGDPGYRSGLDRDDDGVACE